MTRFGSKTPSRAPEATALGTLAAPLSLLLALAPARADATPLPGLAPAVVHAAFPAGGQLAWALALGPLVIFGICVGLWRLASPREERPSTARKAQAERIEPRLNLP